MTVEQSIEDQLNARKEKNKAEQKWSYQSKTAQDLLSALDGKDVCKSDREAKLISRASAAMREARQLQRCARSISLILYHHLLFSKIFSPKATKCPILGGK